MLVGFLLSLREGLEGALIIGIILAALKKTSRIVFVKHVWMGVAAAIAFCLGTAWLLGWLGLRLEGRAEEIFEGIAMLLAAALLTWMIFWMQRQSYLFRNKLEENVNQAARREKPGALFWLAFLAVGREGLELVLFLFATSLVSNGWSTMLGAWLGLVVSILIGWLVYRFSLQLKIGKFFLVINAILVLLAAGLVAHAVHEFNEAGIIPSIIEHVWDINPIINEKKPLGQILTSLFGYNANPSLTEVIAYLGYFLVLTGLWKALSSKVPLSERVDETASQISED